MFIVAEPHDFYGRNMNAWSDRLTYIDDPPSGMTHVSLAEGEAGVDAISVSSRAARAVPRPS